MEFDENLLIPCQDLSLIGEDCYTRIASIKIMEVTLDVLWRPAKEYKFDLNIL